MKKYIIVVMIFTIISKILGFGRDIILSYYYGAGSISDAYLISTTIPLTIFAMVGVGISTGLIPILTKIISENKDESENDFINNVINIVGFLSLILVVISLIFSKQIVNVFATGFDQNTFELAVLFTRISLIGIIFSGAVFIFTSYLQVKNKFSIAALVGIPFNFFVITSIILSVKVNLIVLPVGSMLAFLAELLFLLPFVYKAGYKYKFTLNFADRNISEMIKISIPAIIGISAIQINVLIDRTIASTIAVGGISALNYSNRLIGFVIGIFIAPIITVIYPKLSKSIVEGDLISFKKNLNQSIIAMSLFVIPSMFGLLVFSEPIIKLMFGRGEFDSNSVLLTSGALLFYSLSILSLGLREVLSRSFYAMKETKIPVSNTIISVLINIVLNIVLSRFMGINGLALATTISAGIATLLMFRSLRKKIGPFGMKEVSISLLKILFATTLMSLVSRGFYNYISTTFTQNSSLLLAISIGAITYFITVYFMKIRDVDNIVEIFKKRIRLISFK